MKKIIPLLLAIVIFMMLCACGKSEAVTKFEGLVEQIGTVTIDSEELIIAAEEAYNVLADVDKEIESVTEYSAILTEKRKTYNELVLEKQRKAEQEARLDSVEALIEAIGDVTVDSLDAILAAEDAYSKLAENEKEMISDSGKMLSESRAAYENAVFENELARAEEVSSAINAIGTVTIDSKGAIDNARAKYEALSISERGLLDNYDVLQAAEQEYSILCEAEKQRIISEYSWKFNQTSDPFDGITWYEHNSTPQYIDIRSYIIPYIGVKGDNQWICIRYNYTGDNWIFWENLTIMVDGIKYYKNVGYYNTIRDNDSEVWEFYDEALKFNQGLDTEELIMLDAIANSKETIIRFQGDDYHFDLYVSNQDKQMIRDVLIYYKAMLE